MIKKLIVYSVDMNAADGTYETGVGGIEQIQSFPDVFKIKYAEYVQFINKSKFASWIIYE